ncbi:MAG: hypothetical protein WAJ85_05310 [Candidatus Baltobacteraceae bacterium]|jgi:hypothetical protein
MVVMVLTGSLALLAVLAIRFGADSRETERLGWIVERPQPLRARARAKALRAASGAPAPRCPQPAVQTV